MAARARGGARTRRARAHLGAERLRHLGFELRLPRARRARQLLDGEAHLLDLGLVGAGVLLQGQVVLLLLPRGDRPLLHLLLVPVHLQLEGVHALVATENAVLCDVESVLELEGRSFHFTNVLKSSRALSEEKQLEL